MRRDLRLRRAEAASYVARASLKFISLNASFSDDPCATFSFSEEERDWFDGEQTVIVLGVTGETALRSITSKAEMLGLTVHTMTRDRASDAKDKSEDERVLVCAVIGPHDEDSIDAVTSKLKLF
jgi:peptidyl-tRNA hydrolase